MFPFFKRFFSDVFYLDLRSLALLRICTGGLIIADLIDRSRDLQIMYTDAGALPRAEMLSHAHSPWFLSLYNLNGSLQFQAFLFLVTGIFALMLLIGYRTTLATIASWILVVSLQYRNFLVLFGADQVLRLILFWGIFLPWHAKFSVDAALSNSIKLKNKFISAATSGYILQVIFIYAFSATLKSDPAWRTEGTAIYYALAMLNFRTPVGDILFQFPQLMKAMTYYVFYLEAIGWAFLFITFKKDLFRFLVVLAFVSLHIGIGLTMRLGIFPWVCIFAWLALLPGSFWDVLFKKIWRTKSRLTIYYDYDCGLCYKVVRFMKIFLLMPKVVISASDTNQKIAKEMVEKNSWIVVDHSHNHHYKYEGFIAIAKASPMLFIFLPILSSPPVKFIGNYLYKAISENRKKFCVTGLKEPVLNKKLSYKSWVVNCLAAFFVIYIFYWNINTIPIYKGIMPLEIKPLGTVLGIGQRWGLFAPVPPPKSGWYIIGGKLENGSFYDFQNNSTKISFKKPASVAYSYKTTRWQKYLTNLALVRNQFYANLYTGYLCRSWNENHPKDQQMKEISMAYIFQDAKDDFKIGRVRVAKGECS